MGTKRAGKSAVYIDEVPVVTPLPNAMVHVVQRDGSHARVMPLAVFSDYMAVGAAVVREWHRRPGAQIIPILPDTQERDTFADAEGRH